MFLTITIDTNKSKKISVRQSRMNPFDSWKKALNHKKRSLWQKFMTTHKDVQTSAAKIEEVYSAY